MGTWTSSIKTVIRTGCYYVYKPQHHLNQFGVPAVYHEGWAQNRAIVFPKKEGIDLHLRYQENRSRPLFGRNRPLGLGIPFDRKTSIAQVISRKCVNYYACQPPSYCIRQSKEWLQMIWSDSLLGTDRQLFGNESMPPNLQWTEDLESFLLPPCQPIFLLYIHCKKNHSLHGFDAASEPITWRQKVVGPTYDAIH